MKFYYIKTNSYAIVVCDYDSYRICRNMRG